MSDLSQNKRPGVITLKTASNRQAIESKRACVRRPADALRFTLDYVG